jgi:hypothetical protein
MIGTIVPSRSLPDWLFPNHPPNHCLAGVLLSKMHSISKASGLLCATELTFSSTPQQPAQRMLWLQLWTKEPSFWAKRSLACSCREKNQLSQSITKLLGTPEVMAIRDRVEVVAAAQQPLQLMTGLTLASVQIVRTVPLLTQTLYQLEIDKWRYSKW